MWSELDQVGGAIPGRHGLQKAGVGGRDCWPWVSTLTWQG